jgi:hypothetical protein
MIENERMPLDMIRGSLTETGRIASESLVPQMGSFDREVLALPRDEDLEAHLAAFCSKKSRQSGLFSRAKTRCWVRNYPATMMCGC